MYYLKFLHWARYSRKQLNDTAFFYFGMPYLSYHMILSKTVFQEDTELGIQKFLIFIFLV